MVLLYIYTGILVYWSSSLLCAFVVSDLWYQISGPSGIKIPSLDICRFIILLSKITHQMLHNHTFSQRNKVTERAVEVKAGGKRKGVGDNF